jgi:uncharacterized protein
MKMELATLSRRYGNFFAPAFAVRIGDSDLMREGFLAINQVEVDMVLGAASRFTFTVVDSYSFKSHSFETGRGRKVFDLLKFGSVVDIYMGYGDSKSVPRMLSGVISEITTSFPDAGSPELAVSGYDHAFPLTLGKNSNTWRNKLDSDVAQAIASFHNLNSDIEQTKERHPQIEQSQESDFEFLKKLADRNHFELYVDSKRALHFRKPNDTASPILRLVWGEGLLSFKPQANLAGQISKVEVYGRDIKKNKTIIGIARAGEESGKKGKGKSAGERLKAFVKDPEKQPTLRLRQPVFTQAEAEKRAFAALNERAKGFLTGDAEAIGVPEIQPDCNVSFDNLGAPFSKTYYVQQATHKIDSNGYRTRFKVKETGL